MSLILTVCAAESVSEIIASHAVFICAVPCAGFLPDANLVLIENMRGFTSVPPYIPHRLFNTNCLNSVQM
jgi:hypothetical protein